MRQTVSALALCIAAGGHCSSQQNNPTDSTTSSPVPPITTIIPGFSYLAKIDCIGCSFLDAHGQWEQAPRPNSLLLNFTIALDEISHPLLLNGLHFDPLYYGRRAPMLMGAQSFPWAPPFKAYQVPSTASAEDLSKYQPSRPSYTNVGSFELAYEHTSINYAPDNPRKWLAFLELEITGLCHESHRPKDLTFGEGSEQTLRAIKKVRILLSYDNPSEEKTIEEIELVPKASRLEASKDDTDQKSMAGSDWGGRLNTSITEQIWTTHVSFRPAEWNDCGRKDERLRQVLCKVEDFTDWLKLYLDPHLILALFVILCIIIFTGLCGLGWLGWRCARASWMKLRERSARQSEETEGGQGLLDGDETFEGKEEEEETID